MVEISTRSSGFICLLLHLAELGDGENGESDEDDNVGGTKIYPRFITNQLPPKSRRSD
jgi:hypothetical protein